MGEGSCPGGHPSYPSSALGDPSRSSLLLVLQGIVETLGTAEGPDVREKPIELFFEVCLGSAIPSGVGQSSELLEGKGEIATLEKSVGLARVGIGRLTFSTTSSDASPV